ncbi:MAG: hypothetical protein AB2540_17955 [Candidatus Thiodiazotropha endolucinida]
MKSIIKIILIIFLLTLTGSTWATGKRINPTISYSNNCEHFIGSWHSETFNPKGKYTNVQTATYDSNGKLTLKITVHTQDGRVFEEPKVVRNWYCDGNVYITRNDPDLEAQEESPENGPRFKVYKLLGTTPSQIRYRTIVGHSPGVVFTLERDSAHNN